MLDEFDAVEHNRSAWDTLVGEEDEWTRSAAPEVIERARQGNWSVVLIGYELVDRAWLPEVMTGVDVLCLASGGGSRGRR